MIVTEEEAKNMLCPTRRAAGNDDYCACAGSGCMAWRWIRTHVKDPFGGARAMSDFDANDAFGAVLDRLENAYNERLELHNSVQSLTRDLRNANARIDDLSAENIRLRSRPSEQRASEDIQDRQAAESLCSPLTEPLAFSPRARGHAARIAGMNHKVPPDLRADATASQEYVAGWTEARAPVEMEMAS